MTWRQWQVARQLLAEEFVGAPTRQAKADENAQFSDSSKHLRRA